MDPQMLSVFRGQGLPFRVNLEAVNRSVGVITMSLPFLLLGLGWVSQSCPGIDSISHHYFARPGGDVFVGAMIVTSALLCFFYRLPLPVDGYLGHSQLDIQLTRFAGICALVVALVPASGSGCEAFDGAGLRAFVSSGQGAQGIDMSEIREALAQGDAGLAQDLRSVELGFRFWDSFGQMPGYLDHLHYLAAAGLFLVMAYFALVVFPRPQSATSLQCTRARQIKQRRNLTYRICGTLILGSIALLGGQTVLLPKDGAALVWWNAWNLTFYIESVALISFGVSWSLKGRLLHQWRDPGECVPTQRNPQALGRAA